MKKKWWLALCAVVVLAGAGVWYGKTYMMEKMYSHLSGYIATPEIQKELAAAAQSAADNPELQKELDKLAAASGGSAASSGASQPASGGVPSGNKAQAAQPAKPVPAINNKAEATQYALKKFSPQEIIHYTSTYRNINNLSSEQKEQLKSEVMSRFTPEEIKALLAVANK